MVIGSVSNDAPLSRVKSECDSRYYRHFLLVASITVVRLTVNEKGLRSNRRLPANFDGVVGYSIDTPTIFEVVYTESQRTRFATQFGPR